MNPKIHLLLGFEIEFLLAAQQSDLGAIGRQFLHKPAMLANPYRIKIGILLDKFLIVDDVIRLESSPLGKTALAGIDPVELGRCLHIREIVASGRQRCIAVMPHSQKSVIAADRNRQRWFRGESVHLTRYGLRIANRDR